MQDTTATFVHFAGPGRYEVLLEQAERIVTESGICVIPNCYEVTDVLTTSLPLCREHVYQTQRDCQDALREMLADPMSRIIVDDCDEILDDEVISPAQQSMAEAGELATYVRRHTPLRKPKSPLQTPAVYYLRMADHIKIGFTSDLKARLASFSAHPDALLAVEPGGRTREAERSRVPRTELFEIGDNLLSHIAAVRSAFGDPKQYI